MAGDDQFKQIAGEVAREFLGEPNKSLSSKTELRFGNKGSMSVDLEKGTFYDHSESEGGGVLWLVERETGKKGKDAVQELSNRGFDIEDRGAPPPPADQGGGSRGQDAGKPRMRPVAEWDYRDADGNLLFQVVRLEDGTISGDGKPAKTYRQRRPDDSARDGWNWSTKGVQMVPYRLPELMAAIRAGETVFVVEGEKAADRLIAEGIPATTNARGAGKWQRELNQYFAGARLVVLPDNDPQATYQDGRPKFHENGDPVFVGLDHAHAVAGQLEDIAKEIKLLELPDLPLKGDVVEWLDAGNDIDRLYDLADAAPRYEAQPFRSAFNALTWGAMDDPGPEHEWLVKNTITRRELSMVAGPSKSGKSFLVLDLALSIARGVDWFGRKTMRGGVIYQAGEGAMGIKKRIRAYREHTGLTTKDQLPFVLLPSRVDLYNSEDHTDALIAECLAHKKRDLKGSLELIVIDTWATATPGANENDGKDVSAVLERCARINRETGSAVLLVHHMNADGAKVRGHTSILANLENVLIVKQVDDHHDADGRQIREAKLDKNKDGEGGQSFRFVLKGVRIGTDEDGDAVTSCVVKQPDGTGSDAPAQERPNVTSAESVLLRAIEKAMQQSGSPPPYDAKLPSGADTVVEWKLVAAAYDSLSFDQIDEANETADERTKRLAARRQAMKRSGENLMKKGIIGRDHPYVWLSGRRVKGYRPTGTSVPEGHNQPPPDHTEPAQSGMWDEDDFR